MPKERFISYPGASPDSDSGSLLIGWAGWDHKDQATALIGLISDRSAADGWNTPAERESRNLTENALRAWQPPPPQRGRRT